MGSSLLSEKEIAVIVEEIIQNYKSSERLPSKPDSTTTVGYDYVLLLYALTKLKHPFAVEILEKTLSSLDPAGAWVEYYENGKPRGTRYRPWESGINLEAAICFFGDSPAQSVSLQFK